MTQAVQDFLDTFDRLPESLKREAFAELLQRAKSLEFDLLSDDELLHAADELFLDLDRREAADERP